jgi:hypothetical protein
VPASYLQPGQVFDFTDLDNAAAGQLFNEVVSSLAPAFSLYTNDPAKGNRITRIQQDAIGFAQQPVRRGRACLPWKTDRGLVIVKTAIVSIEYDAHTANCSRRCSAPTRWPARAAIPTCRPRWRRAFQSAGENAGVRRHHGHGHRHRHAGRPAGSCSSRWPRRRLLCPAPQPHRSPAADDPIARLKKAKADARRRPDHPGRLRRGQGQGAGSVGAAQRMASHPPTRPAGPTGPGSPQDMPPAPGSFPLDMAQAAPADPRRTACARPGRIDTPPRNCAMA